MAEEKQNKGPKSGKPSAEEIAAKKAAKKAAKASIAADEEGDEASAGPAPTPRLYTHYREKVIPELKQKLGQTNVMAIPRLEKIIISMGVGKFASAGEKEK